MKFEHRIKKNKAIKIEMEPGGVFVPKIASISKDRPFKRLINIICICDFTSQNKEGKKNRIITTLTQFKGYTKEQKFIWGSKIENRLFIVK